MTEKNQDNKLAKLPYKDTLILISKQKRKFVE